MDENKTEAGLMFRRDEHGGFTVGNIDSGRVSYAEPHSKNAQAAQGDPERIAQAMNTMQATTRPTPAERASSGVLWDRLNKGEQRGETRSVEERTVARSSMTQDDNTASRQHEPERPPGEASRVRHIPTEKTTAAMPEGALRPQPELGAAPRIIGPSGGWGAFQTKAAYAAEQFSAKREGDQAAAPSPDRAAALAASANGPTPSGPEERALEQAMPKAARPTLLEQIQERVASQPQAERRPSPREEIAALLTPAARAAHETRTAERVAVSFARRVEERSAGRE